VPGLFFTGTDTGVGKTTIVAGVVRLLRGRGLRVGVCKPVATGLSPGGGQLFTEDTLRLVEATGQSALPERVTPFTLAEPAAPAVAAAAAGKLLNLEMFCEAVQWWVPRSDLVLVEGVGGLLTPLTETDSVADLALRLGYPVVIVARASLGTLNHTLLTTEAALRRGLPVAGVVVNACTPPAGTLAERTNVAELQKRLVVPVLAVTSHGNGLSNDGPASLAAVDWLQLTRGRRETT